MFNCNRMSIWVQKHERKVGTTDVDRDVAEIISASYDSHEHILKILTSALQKITNYQVLLFYLFQVRVSLSAEK